jgi:monofunctional biosynthetic peptidoglycan transglycosylase
VKDLRNHRKGHLRWLIPVFILVAFLFSLYFLWIPNLSRLNKENPKKTAFMQYREREWREKGKKFRIDQTWVALSNISPYLIKAVVIAEDDNFWRHEGFDYEAIQKAIERDIRTMRLRFGGSTISQQLARNLYLSPSKTLIRKIREAIITWRMEKVLSKKRILELYLNVVEWGEGIFGVEAASRHYYGKPSSEITSQQAARLVAVLPNPRRYNPAGNQQYVIARSNAIYNIMIQRGMIIPEYEELTESESPSSPPLPKDISSY